MKDRSVITPFYAQRTDKVRTKKQRIVYLKPGDILTQVNDETLMADFVVKGIHVRCLTAKLYAHTKTISQKRGTPHSEDKISKMPLILDNKIIASMTVVQRKHIFQALRSIAIQLNEAGHGLTEAQKQHERLMHAFESHDSEVGST